MVVKIPLGGQPQGRPALSLPLGGGGQGLTARESALQRAVVGAAALKDPALALAAVKAARETPEKPLSYKEDDIRPVIQAVAAAQELRPGDVVPEENQRSVARAVAADPVLLAVAAAAINDGGTKAAEAARLWSSIDADMLERAARAAARELQFSLVPDTTTRLGRIEDQLKDLGARVAALETAKKP